MHKLICDPVTAHISNMNVKNLRRVCAPAFDIQHATAEHKLHLRVAARLVVHLQCLYDAPPVPILHVWLLQATNQRHNTLPLLNLAAQARYQLIGHQSLLQAMAGLIDLVNRSRDVQGVHLRRKTLYVCLTSWDMNSWHMLSTVATSHAHRDLRQLHLTRDQRR